MRSLLVLVALLSLAAIPRAVAPVRLSPALADSARVEIETDRADSRKWLKDNPTSYLAAVARTDFEDKPSLVVGSAADCDVRIADPTVSPHHLRVSVAGDSFRVVALDAGATFRPRDADVRSATLAPSSVRLGRCTLRLSHQRFPAIIVFDPQSPRFAEYHGLEYYPVDLRYRFVVPLTANPRPDTTIIMSTRGNSRRAVRAGWFDVLVNGKPVRLEAHRLLEPGVDESSVGVFFRDATSGHETYGVGRYVDPQKLPDGRWLVDFNLAYNPACATSAHYNCPIPSKANTLTLAIRAGEKDSHYSH